MIISKTPFRVSFFGGGTDYPEYFEQHGGAVLGTAVDKFCYVAATKFYAKLFDYNIRLAYRQVECVNELNEIAHAPFRECLRYTGVTSNIEVDYTAELPSSTGLGTSSSFVVSLLNALYAHQGTYVRPIDLAYRAIEIERKVLGESVGCQDQTFAAFGGFNVIEFRTTEDIVVHRIPLSAARMQEFEDHLLLVFTGIRRRADELAARQVRKVSQNLARLNRMRQMVDEGFSLLTGNGSLAPFGELLHEGWMLKSQLDDSVSNGIINEMYQRGLAAGALGGKLLGAGGGGFVLLFVPPERRQAVIDAFPDHEVMPIGINAPGTQIIHN